MTAALIAALDIAHPATFISRVQQLQKLGIPRGSNTGRGAKIPYTPTQAAELLLALHLLDLGITPAVVAEDFTGTHPLDDGLPGKGDGPWLLYQAGRLSYLREAKPVCHWSVHAKRPREDGVVVALGSLWHRFRSVAT